MASNVRWRDILDEDTVTSLLGSAWAARENAHIIGPTMVGAAALATDGTVYAGCNVEHRFRSHDVHAEVNAITTMVTAGRISLKAIVVVAERERFTPCGACMDWIFQFAAGECLVLVQAMRGGQIDVYSPAELMPHYPR